MAEMVASTYEILKKIGSGGAGVVYLGRHVRLDKPVVLKADKRKLTTKADILRREVDALKNLSHTYIPQVYDYVQEGDKVYTVMDYIEGESLDKPLRRGERFSQPQVIEWARELLEALIYLHTRPPHGILHCDIKPSNIMVTPENEIRLIDFNIAYALGESGTIVAFSPGYASPEHYGRDLSSSSKLKSLESQHPATDSYQKQSIDPKTPITEQITVQPTEQNRQKSLLDVRSDIYSLGATLYHLLTGEWPPVDAEDVVPISRFPVSPLLAAIIEKAMQPNPDDRYQTAAEMLWDFEHLHENDLRTKRLNRRATIAAVTLSALLLAGGVTTFFGLKQQEREHETARIVAEQAEEAERLARQAAEEKEEAERRAKSALELIATARQEVADGNSSSAASHAVEALSLETQYDAQAQTVLTEALGVYDLASRYRAYTTLSLPSEPIKLTLSPSGTRAAVLAAGTFHVFDTSSGDELSQFAADPSALSEAVFLDDNRLAYAGSDALVCYDLAKEDTLWTGQRATGLSLSADGSAIAAIYRDDGIARVYSTEDGTLIREIDFEGKHQRVLANDGLIDPGDNLFLLNETGRFLAVNFESGALWVFDMVNPERDIEIFDESDYVRFEGGFSGKYFAFSGKNSQESKFMAVDLDALEGTQSTSSSAFHVSGDERAIYLALQDTLVIFDPVTTGQTELAKTASDIVSFDVGEDRVLVSTEDGTASIFDRAANLLQKIEAEDRFDLAAQGGTVVALASLNKPSVRLLREDRNEENILFKYDPTLSHSEARVGNEGRRVLFFNFQSFSIYDIGGDLICQIELPEPFQIYDQQFRCSDEGDYLEVIYNDGSVQTYSLEDGGLLSVIQGEAHDEEIREAHDEEIQEDFLTDYWRIVSTLYGEPQVYDRETGDLVGSLEANDYLAYVTQLDGGNVMAEFVSVSDRSRYGLLIDENLEVLARLPQLCDVRADGSLVFDDKRGTLRTTRVYTRDELVALTDG